MTITPLEAAITAHLRRTTSKAQAERAEHIVNVLIPAHEAKTGSNLELHEDGGYVHIVLTAEDGTKRWVKVIPLAQWSKGDIPPVKDGVYQDPKVPSSIYTRSFGNWTHNTRGGVGVGEIPQGLVLIAEFPF